MPDSVQEAKKRGITVSCDLNYRKNLWSSEKAGVVMGELMRYVDLCIANEEDADKVFGIRPADNNVDAGRINREGYMDVARELCRRFNCRQVAVTLRESISAMTTDGPLCCMKKRGPAFPDPI